MLWISIVTWEPEKRDEVTKRRMEKGPMHPEGVKALGEWVDLRGGRVISLTEGDDPSAFGLACYAWNDITSIDSFPVMETEPLLDVIKD
jgi:Domain of unknown function (DUF3303)